MKTAGFGSGESGSKVRRPNDRWGTQLTDLVKLAVTGISVREDRK